MSTLTLTRSPRYIRSTTFSNAIKVKLELYIFTGLVGSKPATATYTIEKDRSVDIDWKESYSGHSIPLQ